MIHTKLLGRTCVGSAWSAPVSRRRKALGELSGGRERVAAGEYKWHGGAAAAGVIVGVPCYASSVLCFDPVKEEVSFFGELGDEKAKWYGGILARASRRL